MFTVPRLSPTLGAVNVIVAVSSTSYVASGKWNVPAAEITVRDGVVSHAKSGKTAGFGDLLADAAKVTPPESPTLKDPKAFTLIGTDRVRRKDSQSKVDGTARFTQDVRMDNMLVAMVAHSPKLGG